MGAANLDQMDRMDRKRQIAGEGQLRVYNNRPDERPW